MASEDEIRNIVRDAVRQALSESQPQAFYAPWTGVEYEAHPSRQQFNIDEATSISSDLLELVESKLCSIEKNKTCDHCGMCRNLGY
jgi:hypothetical protein